MAKRVNFPKPLYLSPEVINLFIKKFNHHLRINFFSNIYVYASKNVKKENIAYLVGELNGICVSDSWLEEKNNFTVFIASAEDYNNALKGIYSEDFLFFIKNINKRQSLVDEKGIKTENGSYKNRKVTANVYIVLEEDFISYHKDRKSYIKDNKIEDYFNNELLLNLMQQVPENKLF
ncbi:hypothetical protein [Riemerella anatipestifer]|uniref:Uncharacterized protein n=1 Tax=Riemerella anatipestifer RA-CH-1 TaxID=1228997 RepID=J9R7Q0_RIEAN|nr:hypothetical protein [Riemerella anatipestifer]AFR36238.1 hypothetical protein B739_1646 [Riemerella anatipestifer RA-CH-1]MCO7331988.1 hypothetical protein [Riemerella anatipestifer]MCO7350875.1 hypothetical protein [Riemerella anatipestifer]MCU7582386.1 hypothetical protein [Riemerella anatipestifer]MCW0492490.1 hypothetical protein [Riemerella anatipestifer]